MCSCAARTVPNGRSSVDHNDVAEDLVEVLLTAAEIDAKLDEIAVQIDADYAGEDLLLVGVLKGATMVMADLARKLRTPAAIEWMAISSYGSGSSSSGVVRILKDLDTDIAGRNVLVVEDVLDSGLTLDWLRRNLGAQHEIEKELGGIRIGTGNRNGEIVHPDNCPFLGNNKLNCLYYFGRRVFLCDCIDIVAPAKDD